VRLCAGALAPGLSAALGLQKPLQGPAFAGTAFAGTSGADLLWTCGAVEDAGL
jgi:hypothetical protein